MLLVLGRLLGKHSILILLTLAQHPLMVRMGTR
jgi:hypothetical protein